jgi:hypothetical protein
MSYVPPSAPLSIGGVLDDWLRIFRSSFSRCWAIALIATAAGALIEYLAIPKLPPAGTPSLQYYLHMFSAMSGPQGLFAQIPFWLVIGIVYGALLTQQSAVIRGDTSLTGGKALAAGLNRLPQMVFGAILFVLIMIAVAIPIGIIAAVDLAEYHEHFGLGISPLMFFTVLGALLAISAFMYLGIRLQLWPAAIFADDYGGAASLGRSWDLVRGHWWRVAAIGFVAGVVTWILQLAVEGSLMMIAGVFGTHIGDVADFIRRVRAAAMIVQLARIVTMPLITAVWLAIYHDLKLRREGGDLAARAEALGTS